ncbi:hypothetical protein DT73_17205 [Mangrovibacter sp. MFB070]|uniref:hypothetical protein n=1 Tax=Mangrovibacter sp. MFB070 TaxID=1224318 RepID=UPI0004D9AFB7|nr:hypothetical protein [Mangrovibacter sp. MFB070]KEA51452.1 hypothetical protein DT73_17205 [Mangrovibacter sp. MFB070]
MSSGLITLNNGENVVSGEGTAFSHDLTSGDFICARAGGILYTLAILSVDSDTDVTLVKAHEGPDETGLAWYAVPRRLQNQITAELVAQNTEALRRANANDANYQRLLTESGYITITMQNGGEFYGPTWPKIVEIVEAVDLETLEPLVQQIHDDVAQVRADTAAAEVASAAASESATEARKQATTATDAASSASKALLSTQEHAAKAEIAAAAGTEAAARASTEADRAEEAANKAEAGLPDADVIWEALGIDPDNVTYMQAGYINPTVYNTGFGVGSTMLAARVNGRGPANYSAVYPGLYLRPAAILAPYQSAGESPAVVQLQTNAAASGVPGSWRQLGYGSLSENAASPIEGESYPVTLWIRIF